MPAGAYPRAKARTRSSRSGPDPRAPWPGRSAVRGTRLPRERRDRHAGHRERPPAARRAGCQGGAGLSPCPGPPDLHLRADAEPCRRSAGRRPRARSRAAQGARARVSARPHGRRSGCGAALAATPGFGHGDGPHQRRHHLRRPGPSLRDGPGETMRANSRRRCRARVHATTAARSRKFSSVSKATSTPSIPCCSARPR